jgi:predicted porin
MRNTKIALAVLALVASTAAMAETTVYGTLDVSAAKLTNQATAFDGSGNWAGSIFGFTGSEEVDGGLKVTYALELGLNAGSGRMANGGTAGGIDSTASGSAAGTATSAGSTVFNRQANVGLAGDFGSIKAGLQLSPYIASVVGTGVATNNESYYVNLLAMSGSASATVDGTRAGSTGGFFIPNSVSYTTPNIGGFSATALTALSNSGVASSDTTAVNEQKYSSYSVSYSAGDIRVSGAYESARTNLLAGLAESSNMAISATYHMGPARIAGAYIDHNRAANNTNDFRTYSLGAAFDATDKIELSANYASTNATTKSTLAVAGAQYKLSKSTALYATVGRGTNGVSPLYSTFGANVGTGTGNTSSSADTTGYAVGMYKSF